MDLGLFQVEKLKIWMQLKLVAAIIYISLVKMNDIIFNVQHWSSIFVRIQWSYT